MIELAPHVTGACIIDETEACTLPEWRA